MFGNGVPFELVAIGTWLLLLFAIDHHNAYCYAQRFYFLGKFMSALSYWSLLVILIYFTSFPISLRYSTKHWRWFCSTYFIAFFWISIHRWRNGHTHWNFQSNCQQKRNKRHWWHSKMYPKLRIRMQTGQMDQSMNYNRQINNNHRRNSNRNSNRSNIKDTMKRPSK